jgi:transposase
MIASARPANTNPNRCFWCKIKPALTVEHPFGTMKARMGATHFLTKTLPKVAAEMALSVLAYNLTRVMNIIGIKPMIAAIAA